MPIPALNEVEKDVWPPKIDYDFSEWLYEDGEAKHRKLLTGERRADYSEYLNNKAFIRRSNDKDKRAQFANDKYAALHFYELQTNQVYRRSEPRKGKEPYPARYAVCTYDCCEIIRRAHSTLFHAGTYI